MNSSIGDADPSLSTDGSTLYFIRRVWDTADTGDIWQVSIEPVVDFNADGIVDCADICIMVDHWQTNEPSCDIGTMPWGDGIVDFRNLIVLTEYWLTNYRLIAHWKMDETEGTIAYDSIGSNDSALNGDPYWQPTTGKVDGALKFNGTDNYISTVFAPDSSVLSFSVFAWVKGGTPGQVIISQMNYIIGPLSRGAHGSARIHQTAD